LRKSEVTTVTGVSSRGSLTVTATPIQDATLTAKVTDANGRAASYETFDKSFKFIK
jgi:hypothetical protein